MTEGSVPLPIESPPAQRARGRRALARGAAALASASRTGPSVTLDFLKTAIGPGMDEVDRALRESLHSDVALIRQVADYIIGGGGKRLRPALLLLTAGATGYQGREHYLLAAVLEMIHTATLLHDDVVDESSLRRGRPTANAMFGNAPSVLVGDFLHSRAFQLLVAVGRDSVLRIVSDATNVIAEGEVLQLMNSGHANVDERAYLEVIQRKTAKLFEAAARLGAVLGGAEGEREAAFARYGMHVGTAFQIMDDVLDYSGDAGAIGKNLGDDLAEGKMTLPLIRALQSGSAEDAATIRHAVEGGGRLTDFRPVVDVLQRTGALAYARSRAAEQGALARACLAGVPPSPHARNLLELATFAADRAY